MGYNVLMFCGEAYDHRGFTYITEEWDLTPWYNIIQYFEFGNWNTTNSGLYTHITLQQSIT